MDRPAFRVGRKREVQKFVSAALLRRAHCRGERLAFGDADVADLHAIGSGEPPADLWHGQMRVLARELRATYQLRDEDLPIPPLLRRFGA